MPSVRRLGSVLAAIQLTAVPGYADGGTAYPDGFRPAPAGTLSSGGGSRLAPSFFEGPPPLSQAAVPPNPKGNVHREPPLYRNGPALGSPPQPPGSPLSPRQNRAGDDREEVRPRFSAPLYLSAALTVSAAAVARLSKDRADDAYETYLKSAGRQRQQSHFEEAERYDRIAGAAFAVMEAGLVWSVYLLFF